MPNYERNETLDRQMGAMAQALRVIANYGDCLHQDHPDEVQPCSCPVCVAKRALATEVGWRYIGAHINRLATNPREAKIMEAWKRYFSGVGSGTPDHKLGQLLDSPPTVRDWFVASTIVQWLATNVGQCILSEADYHHVRPEDRVVKTSQPPGEMSPKKQEEQLTFNVERAPGYRVFPPELVERLRTAKNNTPVMLVVQVHEDGGYTVVEDNTNKVPPPSERVTEPGKRKVPQTATAPESTRETLMMEVFQDLQSMVRTEGVQIPQDMPWYNREGIVGLMLSPAVQAKLHRLYPGLPYPVHTIQLVTKLFKEAAEWLDASSVMKR